MWNEIALLASTYLLTWPVLVVLVFAGILFEHTKSHGWAVFTGIVSMVVGYFCFDIDLKVILEWAVGYLVIGVVWSFWRYSAYVSEAVKKIKELGTEGITLQGRVDALSPSRNIDLITAWIIIWPFSAVENILSDVITAIQTLVTKVFRSVYTRIYTSHIESLKDLTK